MLTTRARLLPLLTVALLLERAAPVEAQPPVTTLSAAQSEPSALPANSDLTCYPANSANSCRGACNAVPGGRCAPQPHVCSNAAYPWTCVWDTWTCSAIASAPYVCPLDTDGTQLFWMADACTLHAGCCAGSNSTAVSTASGGPAISYSNGCSNPALMQADGYMLQAFADSLYNDLKFFASYSVRACAAACDAETLCVGFVYAHAYQARERTQHELI